MPNGPHPTAPAATGGVDWDEKLSKAASPEGIHHSVIVLRFSMAEVRISADNNELCDRLIQGVTGIEIPDRLVAAKLCTLALPLPWWSGVRRVLRPAFSKIKFGLDSF